MVNYRHIIDAQTWAFIEKTEAYYGPDASALDIDGQRAAYDAMCAAFDAGRPEGLAVTDRRLSGVSVRIYGEGPVTVLYMHGGSLMLGGLDSHDDVCAEISVATGFRVVAVDYALLPEHDVAQAIADCHAVLDHLEGPVVLCGDSAGGFLAAMLAGSGDVQGQVLIYPGLGGDVNAGSYLRHANAPMLTRAEVLASGLGRAVPESPLAVSDFSGLPPTMIVSAECDPLADDARHYRDAIQDAGGNAVWVEEPGLVHGYLRARHSVDRARRSFARICRAIEDLGAGLMPVN